MQRIFLYSVIALVGFVASAAADEKSLTITGFTTDEIELFEDENALKVKTIFDKQAVNPNDVVVRTVSDTLMIEIEFAGTRGWIYPFVVETTQEIKDIGPCNARIGDVREAAARSIGTNC